MDSVLPKGFWAGGVACGVKKNKKKLDLALFYSEVPGTAAGVFTSNQVKAAPVVVSKEQLASLKRRRSGLAKSDGVRAIIANSGCANACTGERGLHDAQEMCSLTAQLLGIRQKQVLVASTGVIGRYLPMPKIRHGIKNLVTLITQSPPPSSRLRRAGNHPIDAVNAIMTTDTFPKIVYESFLLPSLVTRHLAPTRIWACAKGAGMIHPDLATLLCFILTDVAISSQLLKKALRNAVTQSFNCITIDGETSTNDCILLLANGLAGNRPIRDENAEFYRFQDVLNRVTLNLAKMVVQDGEGATKFIRVNIKNVRNSYDARKVAYAIATSLLVKTAFFGKDPNWGRIMAAIGHSGAKIVPEKIDLSFGSVGNKFIPVAEKGKAVPYSFTEIKRILNRREINLLVDLHQGKTMNEFYTCDLSTKYVKINSAYST